MGILSEMLSSLNAEKQQARQASLRRKAESAKSQARDLPVEIVGPSSGRTISFRVTDVCGTDSYLSQLAAIAKTVDAEFEVCGNLAIFTFYDEALATAFRNGWNH